MLQAEFVGDRAGHDAGDVAGAVAGDGEAVVGCVLGQCDLEHGVCLVVGVHRHRVHE